MGLEAVELVMTYEEAFGVDIPNSEAERMRTPGDVVDFLLPCLGEASEERHICRSARAFRQLRTQIVADRFGSWSAVTPGSSIMELLGSDAHRRWAEIQRKLEYDHWPKLKSLNRVLGWRGGVVTLGQAASEIALTSPWRVHPEPWTRVELEAAVMRLTEFELGLEPGKFTVDSRYVEEMRID